MSIKTNNEESLVDKLNPLIQGKQMVETIVNGTKYVVEKTIDTVGNTIVSVYKDVGGRLERVFSQTETDVARLLNNTQVLLSNSWLQTEQDVVYSIRSPIEKAIHLMDNHFDQIEQIIMNTINEAFEMGNFILWMIFSAILLFFILFGKDIIIDIIDLIKSFDISFK